MFTMNLSIIVLIFFGPSLTAADRMVRFIFNDGVTPTATQTCTAADDALIDPIFNPVARRNLRNSANSTRELWAVYCKDNCRGYATGTCRASGCRGYRRKLNNDGVVVVEDDRELQATCADQKNKINNALNALIANNAVSAGCKSFLDATRRWPSCYDDVVYGEVESVALWNMTSTSSSPTLVSNIIPTSGFSICLNTYFNFEAKVNTCVDAVRFYLAGPSDYVYDKSEFNLPFAIFGKVCGGGPLNSNRLYRTGDYTLTVTPDSFVTKQKVFKFKVIDC